MMACGKHIIATNYSAHTEFCDDNNARLIEVKNLETAIDGVFFDGKRVFGQSLQKIKRCYYRTYEDIHELKQNGELGINNSGIETANKFTWKNTVDKLLEIVNE